MQNPGKDLISIAFLIRSSDKQEDCNCTVKKVKSENDDYPTTIECAIITTNKRVATGEELVLYREKVVKAAPKVVPVILESVAVPVNKKAKHA